MDRHQRDLGLQPHGRLRPLRRAAPSFEKVSPDQRIQAIIIAFCFGALLEALAGFGTPVAITVVMLMALGFQPIKAATVALIANTAPVAFGALATPIVTLATVTSGVSDDPRLDRRHPRRDGRPADSDPGRGRAAGAGLRRRRQPRRRGRPGCRRSSAAWPSALAQFVAANYISVPLTDIIASLVAAAAVVAAAAGLEAGRGADADAPTDVRRPTAAAGRRRHGSAVRRRVGSAGARRLGRPVRTAAPTSSRAYAPYLIIIAIFSIANITAVKDFLAEEPWTYAFPWPGLDVLNAAGDPVATTTFTFNWLPAAGTLMIIAGIITALILQVSPATALRAYVDTYVELKSAIVTVMAVLGLAYVMNQSGQTGTLGAWLAGAGGVFAILSPILGWIGVAVTGSDTSANALFGALQVQTADEGRARPAADGRRQLLRRRARQDGQPAEPGDRRGRGRHGRAGGRHLPQGDRLEPRAAGADVRDRRAAGDAGPRLDGAVVPRRPRSSWALRAHRTRTLQRCRRSRDERSTTSEPSH